MCLGLFPAFGRSGALVALSFQFILQFRNLSFQNLCLATISIKSPFTKLIFHVLYHISNLKVEVVLLTAAEITYMVFRFVPDE